MTAFSLDCYFVVLFRAPVIMLISRNARKIKNRILAIPAAEPAMPPNPRTPATIAIIKNVIDQFNIMPPFVMTL